MRVSIKPHDVVELPLRVLVLGKLEALDPVRLDPSRRPHSADARRADPHSPGHGGPAPVRGSRGFSLQRQAGQARLQRGRKRSNASQPGLILEDASASCLGVAASSVTNLHLILNPSAARFPGS